MSTLKVDAIVDKDSGNTATINGQKIGLGNTQGKNLIINGSMNVSQRALIGLDSTGIGATSGYFNCDRWKITTGNTAGRLTMGNDSSAPSGFHQSTKLTCTTADTSIAADELTILGQSIEAQNVKRFAKGTSDAKPFAVSFYVKGNAAATYVAELYDHDNTRNITQAFSVTTDWAKVTLLYPADTTGAITSRYGAGLTFQIWLHAGSTYSGGTFLNNTWASVTQANRYAGSRTSFFDSTSRTFFITGVQLEMGEVATEFEFEDFATTLHKCQRYYNVIGHDLTDSTPTTAFGNGYTTGSTQANMHVTFPQRMRIKPTTTPPTDQNLDFKTNAGPGAVKASGWATSIVTSETSMEFTGQNHASNFGGAGQPIFLKWNGVQSTGVTSAWQLDAEI